MHMQERIYIIVLLLVIGFPALFFGAYLTEKAFRKRYDSDTARLFKKAILILGVSILAVDILREFDVKLTALLGSAGIAGVALGFALKTSVSNIISGIFVSLEAPFLVGDYIEIDGYCGSVVSFDLLSVKICSPENSYIRIPNEQVLKSNVINHSKYPIKRLSLPIQFPYSFQHEDVYDIVNSVVSANSYCLNDPPHSIKFTGFGESSVDCEICVWVNSQDFGVAKNSIATALHKAFRAAGIDKPYPHMALTNGAGENVLKVEVVDNRRA